MNERQDKQYRHAKREEVVYLDDDMDMKKTTKKSSPKKSTPKKKKKLKPIHWVLIVFVLCGIGFAGYMYASTSSDGPVYGERCEGAIALDQAKIDEAKTLILQDTNIEDITIQVDCLTVKMDIHFASGVSIEDAKTLATNATHQLDDTLGYEKNSEEDSYSKIFSQDGETRQYDLELILYGDQEGYPVFGTKHYQNNEISYTDANVRDQSVVDSINSQAEETQE